MKAAQLIQPRTALQITDLPDPMCPADGVVLDVLACGICRSDWHLWTGSDPDAELPIIPGHEFCGVVRAVGRDVTRWRDGDRVIAPFILACGQCPDCSAGNQTVCATQIVPGFTTNGAYAERIAVPRADTNLTRLPEGMDPALAAALGCRVTTAWHALTGRAALRPGEWLAIWGAGGIGLAAALIGKALGARVVMADVVEETLNHRCLPGEGCIDLAAVMDNLARIGAQPKIDVEVFPSGLRSLPLAEQARQLFTTSRSVLERINPEN